MADKKISNWETNIGIGDLYNLNLDQLAHLKCDREDGQKY